MFQVKVVERDEVYIYWYADIFQQIGKVRCQFRVRIWLIRTKSKVLQQRSM